MKNVKWSVAVLLASLALLACSLPAGLMGDGTLFKDDFSGVETWGIGTDADSSVEYENGGLRITIAKENYYVWSNPGDQDFENSHTEVTVKNSSSDPNTAFGIICHQQVTDSAYYYAAITANGQYAIAKAAVAQDDLFLTNDDTWGDSEHIKVEADSYRLGLDCSKDGKIALYVDGQLIDSVTDTTYTKGDTGLFVWSDEVKSGADITFDDFVITPILEATPAATE